MDEEARFGIGGNNPPFTQVDVARYLAEAEQERLMRRDALLAGVARFQSKFPRIDDDETQGLAGDFAKQIQAAIKQARDAFTVHKKPFREGGLAVDAFFKTIVEPLERGLADVRKPMTDYALRLEEAERRRLQEEARNSREEAARLQRELAEQERQRVEAERAAAEREAAGRKAKAPSPPLTPAVTIEETISAADEADRSAKAAAAKSADLTRNRGDLGSVSSLRELWDVEVTDITQVPPEYLLFDYARARKAVAGGKLKDIPGCRVFVTKHIMTR